MAPNPGSIGRRRRTSSGTASRPFRGARFRLAAAVLVASIALHESAFLLAGTGEQATAGHGYLDLLIPLGVALSAALAAAGVLAAGRSGGGRPATRAATRSADDGAALTVSPLAPTAILVVGFVVQEGAEALLLGGGAAGFASSLAAASLLPPLALLFGAIAALLASGLDRAASLVARSGRRAAPPVRLPASPLPGRREAAALLVSCSLIALNLATRPPPARA